MPYWYASIIVPSTALVPLSVAVRKRSVFDKKLIIILAYLLWGSAMNLVAWLTAHHHNNLPLLHLYTIIEFLLLAWFYRLVLTGRIAGIVTGILLVIFPVFGIVNLLWFQSPYGFNTYVRSIEAVLFMTAAIVYFLSEKEPAGDNDWTENPLNWINMGILLYFSSALFQFTFANLVSATLSAGKKLLIWNIHATLVMFMYFLFAIGFRHAKVSR